MSKKLAIVISPNWRDYAKKYLPELADSLRSQKTTAEIFYYIADNESSRESYDFIKKVLPEARVVRHKHNAGFAEGNNSVMELALKDGCDYLLLINIDSLADPAMAEEMIRAVSSEGVGAAQARLMRHPETSKINSLGNKTHFLGFGYSLYNGEEYSGQTAKEMDYPSGAAVIFRAQALRQVGLFDEEFWMYNEDQDLGWRLKLAGWRLKLAREAVVYHRYSFARSIRQYYWMDRNRMIAVIKNYHWLSLLIITPACLLAEVGFLLAAAKGGWLKEKLRVYGYFFKPAKWAYLVHARKQSQKLRRLPDRKIVKNFSSKILYQETSGLLTSIGNICLTIYWQIARSLIIW